MNATQLTTNTAVRQAYIQRRAEIVEKARRLAQLMQEHSPYGAIDWGHVGDLAHVAGCLDEALSLWGEEE